MAKNVCVISRHAVTEILFLHIKLQLMSRNLTPIVSQSKVKVSLKEITMKVIEKICVRVFCRKRELNLHDRVSAM